MPLAGAPLEAAAVAGVAEVDAEETGPTVEADALPAPTLFPRQRLAAWDLRPSCL